MLEVAGSEEESKGGVASPQIDDATASASVLHQLAQKS